MVLDISINKEEDDDKDVGQDNKESLQTPKPPMELPELYPLTIPPRR
jgi:hypothetical protein